MFGRASCVSGAGADRREAQREVERLAAVEDDGAQRGHVAREDGHEGVGVDQVEALRVRERERAPAVQLRVRVAAEEPHLLARKAAAEGGGR